MFRLWCLPSINLNLWLSSILNQRPSKVKKEGLWLCFWLIWLWNQNWISTPTKTRRNYKFLVIFVFVAKIYLHKMLPLSKALYYQFYNRSKDFKSEHPSLAEAQFVFRNFCNLSENIKQFIWYFIAHYLKFKSTINHWK